MTNDTRRPRARLATLLGVLALIVAGFAASQVIQVRGSWRDLGETEVRTLEERVAVLEKELSQLHFALGIEPVDQASLVGQPVPTRGNAEAKTVPASMTSTPAEEARLQAIDASLEQLDEVRRQLRALRANGANADPEPSSGKAEGESAASSAAGEPQ